MERVLQNLVANALKHVEKGSGEVKLSAFEKANNIVIEVSDNGEGIPAGYHEKIFDKFARVETKKRGLPTDRGLGLAFCKMAIEAHRGRIWAESEEGKGSKFSFTIPIKNSQVKIR
jgi:K+-sensing histidine kinase KdpD